MSGARLLATCLLVLGLLWSYGCGTRGQGTGAANNAAAMSNIPATENQSAGGLTRSVGEPALVTNMEVPLVAPDGFSGEVINGVREIKLTVRKYAFEPDRMVVQLGQPVRILATSDDVTHGFGLRDLGINQKIEPGKETVIEFTPDKAGDSTFHCSVPCGPGHKEMKGTLTVKP